MSNNVGSEMKEEEINDLTGLRKLNFTELASMLHGLLFAYEKVFINLYGNDTRKLYPYIIEELSHLLHTGENPIIDNSKSLEENIERIMFFISNEEYLKDLSFEKVDDDEYVFRIGTCSFAKSGVHEILKIKEGICPFALVIATCLTELNSNGFVRIVKNEFDEEGSKAYLKLIPRDDAKELGILKHLSESDEEIFAHSGFKPPLDELDLKLIKELRINGRQANVELSRALNTSESTVRRRINSLVDKGIIRGFTALLRYPPGDTFMRAFLGLKVDPKHIDGIAEKLSIMKETCSVYKTFGKHNLVCEAIFTDRNRFQEFIDKLQYVEGVLELDYSIGSAAPKPCPWYGF